jgi:hypothetical protein
VGSYGTFTVDSSSEDTVSYLYDFGGKLRTATPKEPGGPVELRWMPESSGVHQLSVQAVDRAGNASDRVTHQFRVASGRTPVARWKLADPAGSAEAGADAGGRPAEAGEAVVFGAEGPSRTDVKSAVRLDGSGGAYLAPGARAVDTGGAFADNDWASSGEPHHLAVVYDDGADEVRLYVDGQLSVKAPFHHSWNGSGGLQVGRTLSADGWGEYLDGAVDEVHAYAGALSEQQVMVLRAGGTSG